MQLNYFILNNLIYKATIFENKQIRKKRNSIYITSEYLMRD